MNSYLCASDVIDWKHLAIQAQANQIASGSTDSVAIARACFGWVRDEVRHSCDYQLEPITWRASDVLLQRTGFCFAKSHLLAALLRANGIPAGFCYQRLSIDDQGAPYCLHGFNAVYLPDIGWYRIDPRGNRPGINAAFTPPHEHLAYTPQLPGEMDFKVILAEPLSIVVDALKRYTTREALQRHLPDIPPERAAEWGLSSASQPTVS